MAEFVTPSAQEVAVNQNVILADEAVKGKKCIMHRQGSGIVTLRGANNGCNAQYKVSFGGNIALPPAGTVEQISVAISVEGEPLASATMISMPSAVSEYSNIYGSVVVKVPCNCCVTVGVKNISTQAITVQNANLIVERIA